MSIVRSLYRDSEFGVETELNSAGTSLENPFVYDSAARELVSMADEGLVEIISEQVRETATSQSGSRDRGDGSLIEHITFARLR